MALQITSICPHHLPPHAPKALQPPVALHSILHRDYPPAFHPTMPLNGLVFASFIRTADALARQSVRSSPCCGCCALTQVRRPCTSPLSRPLSERGWTIGARSSSRSSDTSLRSFPATYAPPGLTPPFCSYAPQASPLTISRPHSFGFPWPSTTFSSAPMPAAPPMGGGSKATCTHWDKIG